MRWLLDTCILSEFTKPSPDSKVVDWLRRQPDDDAALSVLTLGELERGVQRLPQSQKRARLERWLSTDVRGRFEGRLLPVDAAVASGWARLCARAESIGSPVPAIDGLIAATARAHGLTLVTRDEAPFVATGVPLFNPWAL